MAVRNALPFEFPFRWNDVRRFFGKMEDEAVDYLDQRDRDLEDYLANQEQPLIFHWSGQVDRFIDTRNGPGEFGANGTIDRIRYRWDTPPAANATVTWRLDNVLTLTHTLTGGNDTHVEMPEQAYAQETIVSVVTAVGSDALGLTAFVYFR